MPAGCSYCGTVAVDATDLFCAHCGHSIQASRIPCSGCSTLNDADSQYCKHCGAALSAGGVSAKRNSPATAPAAQASAPTHAFSGLYRFVRDHVVIVNGLVGFAITSVSLLDFLSPRLSILPAVIYTGTALLAVVLLASALIPPLDRWMNQLLHGTPSSQQPTWRRGTWQFAVLLLTLVSAFGFESVAKAQQGGVLASRFPAIKQFQQQFLQLHQDLGKVQAGVDQANAKMDRLLAADDDPHRAIRARGYDASDDGLMQAIRNHDLTGVALFTRIGMPVNQVGVLLVLWMQPEPWRSRLARQLAPGMFDPGNAQSCAGPFLTGPESDVEDNLRIYARLCGRRPIMAQMQASLDRLDQLLAQKVIVHPGWDCKHYSKLTDQQAQMLNLGLGHCRYETRTDTPENIALARRLKDFLALLRGLPQDQVRQQGA